jgi:beta-xylosidase
VIEAIKLWNEPNNLSHWDFELDEGWIDFSAMVVLASRAIRAVRPEVSIVLGGMSPIDVGFLGLLEERGVLEAVDAVAVHGFPLDWNHWPLDAWPERIAEIQAVTDLPVWVTEVGVSSFGAEEVQAWGLTRTTELLRGRAPRIFWYSLFDLPQAWGATTRHRESEGSSYYRHFYMGLIRADGTPKPAVGNWSDALGICQWFHFEDERLELAVEWLRRLGVRYLRTGVSWADWQRPGGPEWYDRMLAALEEFELTVTLCFTPEALGRRPNHTSPPVELEGFAEFATEVTERYVVDRPLSVGPVRP